MELKVGIYGECEEDFPEAERMLRDFYQSAGISVPILRFVSTQQLTVYCGGLKGEVFFPLMAREEYLHSLFPLIEKLNNDKQDVESSDITLEILLADFPYPQDFCQTKREKFLPPVSLCLPVKGGLREFIPEQVHYFETNGRNILIHTEKETTEILLTMKAVRKKLKDSPLFVRPHISFLVNLAWVSRIEGNTVILKNKEHIPLSQKRAADFRVTFRHYLSSLSIKL